MEFNNEQWKPIKGYEGIFSVSNMGRIRRDMDAKTGGKKSGYVFAEKKTPNGYMMARLNMNNSTECVMAHRLVAIAFIGDPPDGKTIINHKNGIKDDNRPENLEWVTMRENAKHSRDVLGNKTGAIGERSGRAKFTRKEAIMIHLMKSCGMKHKDIAPFFNVSQVTVTRILNFKRWPHMREIIEQDEYIKGIMAL